MPDGKEKNTLQRGGFSVRMQAFLLSALFLLCFATRQARAQNNAQAVFDQANTALQSGEFRKALNTYQKLEQQQKISGALFLNMAISYVQVDSLGKAKYYFLKASRFDETEAEAEKGLNYVEQRFSRQSAVLPKLPWEKAVDWITLYIGAATLLGIGIILFNIGIISYVSSWFWKQWEKMVRLSGLTVAGLGIGIMLFSFYVQYVSERYSKAVMVHEQTNVMEQPSPDASIVSQAYEGYTFTVDAYRSEEHPGWTYVRMSNGLYGWIRDNEIMVL